MAKKKTGTKKTTTRAARVKTAGDGRAKTPKRSRGDGKLSGLDAAAQILAKAQERMG